MSRRDEVLVSTHWVAEHADDPAYRLVEVDEDAAAYAGGHIRNALAWHWKDDLHDELRREFLDADALLALLGVGSAPAGGAEGLFSAWRTFFERLAAKQVVALVFEDLHWADSGTLDFIDHVLEWSRNVPILIITLARPELLENRPDWGAGRRNFLALDVEPLPEAAMRELLAGLVPGLPESALIELRVEGRILDLGGLLRHTVGALQMHGHVAGVVGCGKRVVERRARQVRQHRRILRHGRPDVHHDEIVTQGT